MMRIEPDTEMVPMPEGHYVKLLHINATLVAVRALLEDGAQFEVTASGTTGSITIYDSRSLSILRQVDAYYRRPSFFRRIFAFLG